jgi:hypothetical protein
MNSRTLFVKQVDTNKYHSTLEVSVMFSKQRGYYLECKVVDPIDGKVRANTQKRFISLNEKNTNFSRRYLMDLRDQLTERQIYLLTSVTSAANRLTPLVIA